jgi:flagellar hook-basal body complex protein FliE
MQSNPLSNALAMLTGNDDFSSPAITSATLGAESAVAPPFSNLLKNAIANVQNLEDQAASAVQGLMSGSGVDVHQAMIATQKSDMAFEMALAVRNKAVAAYQQVMQMQF